MDPKEFQLKLSEPEIRRLGARVQMDYRAAQSDHERRVKRLAEYMRRWRQRADLPDAGHEDDPNLPVPVIKWNAKQKWAANADAIFGDDAEIVAKPVGPTNYKNAQKIGLYMTWRVFNSMKLTNELLQFELYKILHGRVHAYSPWEVKMLTNGMGQTKATYYRGPGFHVLAPDDFVVPAEDVKSLHDFSWVIRKYRATPNELLEGEDSGFYAHIKANFDQILRYAYKAPQRDAEGDVVKREIDWAEGVPRENPLSAGSSLLVLEWHGKWRMLKHGKQDADEWNVKDRSLYESDIVIRYLYDLQLVIGAQDLKQLYPALPKPRPFVESSNEKDGSYWCAGIPEQIIDLEDELRKNHNLGTAAQEMTVSPCFGYRPAKGFEPSEFRLQPGLMVPMDNPQTDLAQIKIVADLAGVAARENALMSYAERVLGTSDLQMGREMDRPNAPKTVGGTMAILQQGNLRMTLDTTTLREDYAEIFRHFWMLEWMFSTDETFFRVTEEDANGLFPVRDGGAVITQEDRNGDYDFHLQLATSMWDRQQEKQDDLARYQLDLQNPLVVNNPQALWRITAQAHKALGDPNFADLIPEPPAPDLPINPKEEWAMIQRGETVHVNPMDNDELHMIRHMKDLQTAIEDKYSDQDALLALRAHYVDHVHQLEQKKMVQAIAQSAVQQAAQLGINPAQMMGTGMNALPPGVMMPPGAGPIPQGPMPMDGSTAPPLNPKGPFHGKPPQTPPKGAPPQGGS